jgi:L-fucose isomerase-like protein
LDKLVTGKRVYRFPGAEMKSAKVGFVTCVHPFYDLPAVVKHRDEAIAALRAAGCEVVSAPIPRNSLDALDIASMLRKEDVDAVLLFFCTWVAEDITLALARETADLPMLLWALPYLDRDIPMPSPMSGLTTSGSNIRRLGKTFAYMVGSVTADRVGQAVESLKVAALVRQLRRARFGVVGYPCPGMMDVGVDEADLQKALGVTTVHLDLDALLKAYQAASGAEASEIAKRLIAETGGIREGTEASLADNLRLYVGMKELVEKNKLDAYCVRCWPELRDQHKITICATHALLARDGVPNSCEVDLPALVTTYVLSRLAGASAFNFDVTGYLEDEGAIQFGHCGAADPALAGDPKNALLRVHMRTGTGATVEFPFKEGTVTLAKLVRPINGRMKMFAARGRVLPVSGGVRGSVAAVRPEPSAEAFLDSMMRTPVEHHIALVYGDWCRQLSQLCDFAGLDYLPLDA